MFSLQIIRDLETCERLWRRFNTWEHLGDVWEVRKCFFEACANELFFVCILQDDAPIGLLPLQLIQSTDYEGYHSHHGVRLEQFGNGYAHEVKMFIPPVCRDFVFAQLPQLGYDIVLTRLAKNYFEWAPVGVAELHISGYKLALDYRDHLDYLDRNFEGKTRNTLLRQVRKLEEQHIQILHDQPGSLEALIELNIAHFGAGSSFNWLNRRAIFTQLLKLPLRWHLLTFVVNGKAEGYSLSVHCGDTYYYLNAGNTGAVSNLGKYIIYQNINSAIQAGAQYFDGMPGDYGWKERHGLTATPLFRYSLTGAKVEFFW